MLRYLIEKEFKQLFRNSFMPKLIIVFPCMMLLIFPWAATLEIEDVKLTVIDHDHSMESQQLIHQIEASNYFKLTSVVPSFDKAKQEVDKDNADVILEIPQGFEKKQLIHQPVQVQISANAVNGMKGSLGSSYLAQIINKLPNDSSIQYLYNPHLDYKRFMAPAIMTMLLFLICGFLPALNIVGEKESGTIEQINVTPVSKITFTLGKLIPYWIIGFFILSLAMLLIRVVYGISPAGSLGTIYIGAGFFILLVSGIGLVISNYSSTLQQAMFVTWFFVIIMILMSGLFTPVGSMPEWAQTVAIFNPLKYFVEFIRMVYLKGSSLLDVRIQISTIVALALFFNAWAVISYKKRE